MDTGTEPNHKKKSRKKTWLIVLGSIVFVLLIIRMILPYAVLKYVNKTLSELKEYQGHVEDIDIALIRGAYKINNIRLDKKDSVTKKLDSIPFFTAEVLDLSVEWRALFKGSIVGEIAVENPVLNFVKGKHKNEDVKADTTDFKEVIKKLMPLTINHFDINNGTIRYVDRYSSPSVDIKLSNIQVKADNLTNVNDSSKFLPASLAAQGDAYGGHLDMKVKFNALEKKPTFDLNTKIDNVNMVNLNDFFKAYGKFTVEKGNFGLYTEFAAKEGKFNGYVKPLIKDMKVKQGEGNLLNQIWEVVVAGAAELFKNQKKDQIATKIPIQGNFDQPETSLWTAISYVLRNAFVFALRPSIDNTIDIGKVEEGEPKKTFLQKIFGKKDKNEKEKKKK